MLSVFVGQCRFCSVLVLLELYVVDFMFQLLKTVVCRNGAKLTTVSKHAGTEFKKVINSKKGGRSFSGDLLEMFCTSYIFSSSPQLQCRLLQK